MAVNIVKSENFEEILKREKAILLDFWATWCGPCQMIAPIVEEIAAENTDIYVGKVNVDEEGELSAAFGIESIPTLALIKEQKIIGTVIGYRSKEELNSIIKDYLKGE